jgi:hypothetical protein
MGTLPVALTRTFGFAQRQSPTGSKIGLTFSFTSTISWLLITKCRQKVMDYLASRYTLKIGSIKEPDSAQVSKFYVDGAPDPEKPRWAMSSEAYVKQAVSDVELELSSVDLCFPTRVSTPLSQGYRPESTELRELNSKRGQHYQGLIGALDGQKDPLNHRSILQ